MILVYRLCSSRLNLWVVVPLIVPEYLASWFQSSNAMRPPVGASQHFLRMTIQLHQTSFHRFHSCLHLLPHHEKIILQDQLALIPIDRIQSEFRKKRSRIR